MSLNKTFFNICIDLFSLKKPSANFEALLFQTPEASKNDEANSRA